MTERAVSSAPLDGEAAATRVKAEPLPPPTTTTGGGGTATWPEPADATLFGGVHSDQHGTRRKGHGTSSGGPHLSGMRMAVQAAGAAAGWPSSTCWRGGAYVEAGKFVRAAVPHMSRAARSYARAASNSLLNKPKYTSVGLRQSQSWQWHS